MPALRNIAALAALALVSLLAAPAPANALAADRAQVARHVHAHDAVARRKRSDSASPSASGRCKPRPSSSLPTAPTSTPPPPSSTPVPPSSTPAPPSSSSAPPPSTTSSAPPSTSTTPSSGNSGKKWGLAWGADPQYLANFARPNVGYIYTWSPSLPSGYQNFGLEGMAMLWGYDQITQFQTTVVAGYAKYALGMNEPNEVSQSNMSPQDAVNLWWQYINPLKDQGYYLISPACTDDDAGLAWYQQFFQLCQGCQIDGVAFHAYTDNAQDLINYATTLHNTYGREIWITEFADQNFSGTGGEPDMNAVWSFAGEVINFVDNTSWVRAAFPFGIMSDLQGVDENNNLLSGDGYPTSLAYTYFG